jgi:GNAT superfamily N-acetyltransferase
MSNEPIPSGGAIRLAVASDLPQLPGIERSAAALFEQFGFAKLFARLSTSSKDLEEGLRASRLWVATVPDDDVVGFALASVVGENAHLDELDVVPDHGRRGIGTALVEAFLRWARDSGFPGATLTTLRHVPWNAPFYQRFGFRVLETRELSRELSELLRQEIERGLPAENRVAMYMPIFRESAS